MSTVFNISKKDGQTVLKLGRKTYATVSYNKNPDYKYILWLKTGIALSGYETEAAAIERAERMQNDWTGMVKELTRHTATKPKL